MICHCHPVFVPERTCHSPAIYGCDIVFAMTQSVSARPRPAMSVIRFLMYPLLHGFATLWDHGIEDVASARCGLTVRMPFESILTNHRRWDEHQNVDISARPRAETSKLFKKSTNSFGRCGCWISNPTPSLSRSSFLKSTISFGNLREANQRAVNNERELFRLCAHVGLFAHMAVHQATPYPRWNITGRRPFAPIRTQWASFGYRLSSRR